MKKLLFIVAAIVTMSFMSCGNSTEAVGACADSVDTDSVCAVAVDSTVDTVEVDTVVADSLM